MNRDNCTLQSPSKKPMWLSNLHIFGCQYVSVVFLHQLRIASGVSKKMHKIHVESQSTSALWIAKLKLIPQPSRCMNFYCEID